MMRNGQEKIDSKHRGHPSLRPVALPDRAPWIAAAQRQVL